MNRALKFQEWMERNGHSRAKQPLEIAVVIFRAPSRGICANDIYDVFRMRGRRRCFASIYTTINWCLEAGVIKLVRRDRRGTHYWRYR